MLLFNVLEHISSFQEGFREALRVSKEYIIVRQDKFWTLENRTTRGHLYIQLGFRFLKYPKFLRVMLRLLTHSVPRAYESQQKANQSLLFHPPRSLYADYGGRTAVGS